MPKKPHRNEHWPQIFDREEWVLVQNALYAAYNTPKSAKCNVMTLRAWRVCARRSLLDETTSVLDVSRELEISRKESFQALARLTELGWLERFPKRAKRGEGAQGDFWGVCLKHEFRASVHRDFWVSLGVKQNLPKRKKTYKKVGFSIFPLRFAHRSDIFEELNFNILSFIVLILFKGFLRGARSTEKKLNFLATQPLQDSYKTTTKTPIKLSKNKPCSTNSIPPDWPNSDPKIMSELEESIDLLEQNQGKLSSPKYNALLKTFIKIETRLLRTMWPLYDVDPYERTLKFIVAYANGVKKRVGFVPKGLLGKRGHDSPHWGRIIDSRRAADAVGAIYDDWVEAIFDHYEKTPLKHNRKFITPSYMWSYKAEEIYVEYAMAKYYSRVRGLDHESNWEMEEYDPGDFLQTRFYDLITQDVMVIMQRSGKTPVDIFKTLIAKERVPRDHFRRYLPEYYKAL